MYRPATFPEKQNYGNKREIRRMVSLGRELGISLLLKQVTSLGESGNRHQAFTVPICRWDSPLNSCLFVCLAKSRRDLGLRSVGD